MMFNKPFRIAALLMICTIMTIISVGCNQQQNEKTNQEKNDTAISDTTNENDKSYSADNGISPDTEADPVSNADNFGGNKRIAILSVGDTAHGDNLELTLKRVYTTDKIVTGENFSIPKKGKTFLVAEMQIANPTDEPYFFWSVYNLFPAIDKRLFPLNNTINAFPDMLNGYQNLVNRPEIPISAKDSILGYFALEVPKDFHLFNLSFCDDQQLFDSFLFENKKSTQSLKKPAALAEADNEGLHFAVTDLFISDGSSEYVSSPEDGYTYLNIQIITENSSDTIAFADYRNFSVDCDGKICSPVVAATNAELLPPDNYIIHSILVPVPDSASFCSLCYSSNNAEKPVKLTNLPTPLNKGEESKE